MTTACSCVTKFSSKKKDGREEEEGGGGRKNESVSVYLTKLLQLIADASSRLDCMRILFFYFSS